MDKISLHLPVHFISAGQFVAREGWIHSARTLDSHVLMLVESGRFVLCEDDRRMEVGPHEAVILRAGHTHYGVPVGDASGEPPVYYWAHFIDAASSQTAVAARCFGPCRDYDRMSVAFHQLISESRGEAPLWMACDYLMSLLLVYLSADGEAPTAPGALFSRMKEYIRLNFRRSLTLEELARTLHYSSDHLSRLFRKNAGMSVGQYVHTLRLTEAKKLLLSTTDTVRQIGLACGYTNEKFFLTTFARREGMTPTQYRNLFGVMHQNDR